MLDFPNSSAAAGDPGGPSCAMHGASFALLVLLETTRDRAAAKVRVWKAARRSQALCEVLINCPVTVSSVRAAYRVDFLATYGSDHELIWY